MYFERLRLSVGILFLTLILWIICLIFGGWLIVIFSTLFLLLSLCQFALFIYNYLTMMEGDWANLTDLAALNLKVDKVLIPTADEVQLSALLIRLKHSALSQKKEPKLPLIILHHGVLGQKEHFFALSQPLAAAGYAVLMVDARGHGETRKNYPAFHADDWYITQNTGIFPDFKYIVDYATTLPEVDSTRIAIIGTSMGGGLVLSQGIKDPRISLIIALSPYFSWKNFENTPESRKWFTEPWMIRLFINTRVNAKKIASFDRLISPEAVFTPETAKVNRDNIRIIFSRNDRVLLYSAHFLPLQSILKLPPEQVLILNEGDHYLRGQETIAVSQILSWLREKFGD